MCRILKLDTDEAEAVPMDRGVCGRPGICSSHPLGVTQLALQRNLRVAPVTVPNRSISLALTPNFWKQGPFHGSQPAAKLINCKTCGREVSSNAASYPQCGENSKPYKPPPDCWPRSSSGWESACSCSGRRSVRIRWDRNAAREN